jgi:hypothetical protein
MPENIRLITLKNDVPQGTTSYKGFHLLNMGKEGMWLVDRDHPGYFGCIKKAIQLAEARQDKKALEEYSKLPLAKEVFFSIHPEMEEATEEPKKEPLKPKTGRKKASK